MDFKSVVDENINLDFLTEEQQRKYEAIFETIGFGISENLGNLHISHLDVICKMDFKKADKRFGINDIFEYLYNKAATMRNEAIHFGKTAKLDNAQNIINVFQEYLRKHSLVDDILDGKIRELAAQIPKDYQYLNQREKNAGEYLAAKNKYERKNIFGKIISNFKGEKKKLTEMGKKANGIDTYVQHDKKDRLNLAELYQPSDYEELLGQLELQDELTQEETRGRSL